MRPAHALFALVTAAIIAPISFGQSIPRMKLETTNSTGHGAKPLESNILWSGRKLNVDFERELIQADLVRHFSSTTDLKDEAQELTSVVAALGTLKRSAADLTRLRGMSPQQSGTGFLTVARQIGGALVQLKRNSEIERRVNDALGAPFGDIDAEIAIVIDATDEYVRETLRRLLAAERVSGVDLSLVIRMLRDPNYAQPVALDSPLVLDQATKETFDRLAPDLMGPDADMTRATGLVGFQLLGLSNNSLVDKIEPFKTALKDLWSNPEVGPDAIKSLWVALNRASSDLSSVSAPGESASAFLDTALGNLNTLAGLVRSAPQAASDAFDGSIAEIRTKIDNLTKAGNALIADIQSVIKGTASFLGIARSFEEIDKWSNSLNAANLQPVIDALAGKELRFGDKIEVTLVASPPEGATVTLGSASLRVFTSGLYRRDEPTVFYAFPQSGDATLQPTIGLGQSAMFYPQWGSASSYDFPPYGFGLTGSILNFNEDGSYEFGLGLTLGFLNNLVVAGYGYNLTHETPYIFAGLKLRIK